MTVITMISRGLTNGDKRSIISFGYKLQHAGLAGVCVPVECDDGEHMVAILNPSNDDILFAFGRNGDGYYVFDWDGYPVIERCASLAEALFAFDCGAIRAKKIGRRNGDLVLNCD